MRSYTKFDRWISQEHRSWQFEIFRQYNKELTNMLISFNASQNYTYSTLPKNGATFESKADDYFKFKDHRHIGTFKTIQNWSDTHNELSKWIYLNALVSLTSNFEIYLSSIIKISIDSDPGTIIGASKSIDGMYLKKYNKHKLEHDDYVIGCVKGTWLSRINNLEKIFNSTFFIIRDNLKHLERLRNTRNDVAHAFGRSLKDIENYEVVNSYNLPRMTYERLIKYQSLIFKIVETLDEYLLKNHIGQYQLLLYYSQWRMKKYPNYNFSFNNLQIQYYGANFRKDFGQYREIATTKNFVKELIHYYENL